MAPLVRTGGSRHTGLAALPHRNIQSVQYVEMRVPNQYENMISMTTLDYIEQQYRTATLTELCAKLNLPMHVLSKMIKKNTGFNFKELRRKGVFIEEYFL